MVPAGSDGVTTAIIYVDTEGFESTGKSDAYDDRIFALSAIISSLLVRTVAHLALLVASTGLKHNMRAPPVVLRACDGKMCAEGPSAGCF